MPNKKRKSKTSEDQRLHRALQESAAQIKRGEVSGMRILKAIYRSR
jgi:hypothetical protein